MAIGTPQAAVIGAGLAGLACANALRDAGVAVTLFEKSRGLGGRLATRRRGDLAFDHGAQYLTATSEPFASVLEGLAGGGAVAPWAPALADGNAAAPAPQGWFIGLPGMSAAVRPLAAGLPIRRQTQIQALERIPSGWRLRDTDGSGHGPFDAVAVCIPAPQAAALVEPIGTAFADIADVEMAPCWTLMAAFDDPLSAAFDGAWLQGGILSWIGRENAKPGRTADGPDRWVAHAQTGWARANLEQEREPVARALLAALTEQLGMPGARPRLLMAHRWRYAVAERPLFRPHMLDADRLIGTAGDWCLGNATEKAWESGDSLGKALAAAMGAA